MPVISKWRNSSAPMRKKKLFYPLKAQGLEIRNSFSLQFKKKYIYIYNFYADALLKENDQVLSSSSSSSDGVYDKRCAVCKKPLPQTNRGQNQPDNHPAAIRPVPRPPCRLPKRNAGRRMEGWESGDGALRPSPRHPPAATAAAAAPALRAPWRQ